MRYCLSLSVTVRIRFICHLRRKRLKMKQPPFDQFNEFIITLTFTISTFLLFKIHLHNYRKCWSNWQWIIWRVKCHSNQKYSYELQLSCWILFPIEVRPQTFILGVVKISLFPLIFKAHLTNKLPICLLWIYGWQTANLKAVCLTSKLFA